MDRDNTMGVFGWLICGALLGAGEIIFIFRKSQVADLRGFSGCEALQRGVAVANGFSANEF